MVCSYVLSDIYCFAANNILLMHNIVSNFENKGRGVREQFDLTTALEKKIIKDKSYVKWKRAVSSS